MGSQRTNFEGLNRDFEVINRGSGGGKVQNVINRPRYMDKARNILVIKLKSRGRHEVSEVAKIPGDEIVHADDLVAFCQKAIAEMGSEKTGGSGNNGDRGSVAHGFWIRGSQCFGNESPSLSAQKPGIDFDHQK